MVNPRPAEEVRAERDAEAKAAGIEQAPEAMPSAVLASLQKPIGDDWIDERNPPKPARFLVGDVDQPAFPLGKVSILAGKGATGKTTLSAQLAIAVASGTGDWLGLAVNHPGRVLWILAEEDEAIARRLVWHAAKAAGVFDDAGAKRNLLANLRVVALAGTGQPAQLTDKEGKAIAFAHTLESELRKHEAEADPWRLVIVDPLSRFSGAENENDNASATKVIESLERLAKASGAAVLACHHAGKGPREGDDAIRGASALLDGARFGMTLARPAKPDGEKVDPPIGDRVLQCVKSNYGPAWWAVPLTFDPVDKVFVLGSSGASATNAKNNRAKPTQRERTNAG